VTPLKDAAFMAVMIPKGLGAAVLASLPAQKGVEGGEIIQSVVFSIILCTTFMTTIMSFLIDKTFISRIYCWLYKIMGLGLVKTPAPTDADGTPEAEDEQKDR
jgi:hypothetical protein